MVDVKVWLKVLLLRVHNTSLLCKRQHELYALRSCANPARLSRIAATIFFKYLKIKLKFIGFDTNLKSEFEQVLYA